MFKVLLGVVLWFGLKAYRKILCEVMVKLLQAQFNVRAFFLRKRDGCHSLAEKCCDSCQCLQQGKTVDVRLI